MLFRPLGCLWPDLEFTVDLQYLQVNPRVATLRDGLQVVALKPSSASPREG
jgi:hypothetical protein